MEDKDIYDFIDYIFNKVQNFSGKFVQHPNVCLIDKNTLSHFPPDVEKVLGMQIVPVDTDKEYISVGFFYG